MAYKVGSTTVIDETGKIDWSRIANAPSSDPLTSIAAAGIGAVGTYAFVNSTTTADYSPGALVAGSNLRYVGLGQGYFDPDGMAREFTIQITSHATAPSGTWRIMGNINYGDASAWARATLALRVS